jgi:glyoxylase-like metal-dependent hydrolase (beta-lactamase superfamily II)
MQQGVMLHKPVIRAFFDEPTNTVSYIVADPDTKKAAVIDPVLDYDPGGSQVDTRSVDALLRADPAFTALHSEPRFRELVRKIGFP